jgi:hypothetical protein
VLSPFAQAEIPEMAHHPPLIPNTSQKTSPSQRAWLQASIPRACTGDKFPKALLDLSRRWSLFSGRPQQSISARPESCGAFAATATMSIIVWQTSIVLHLSCALDCLTVLCSSDEKATAQDCDRRHFPLNMTR